MVVARSEGAVVPYLQATVAGHPLMLLVDTGAEQSLLPAGFVRKHKLHTRSNAGDKRMVDVNGSMMPMPDVPGVAVQFEGEKTVENIDFLLNPADESERMGILSPQDLVRGGGALVLDFPHGELRYEPEDEALKRLRASASFEELDYHRCQLDNHRVTSVAINGVASSLMIDTGSARTMLGRNNEAIPSMLSSKGKLGVVAGVLSTGDDFLVSGVPVVFAKTSFVLTASVLRASRTCGRGLLGADVLAHCILIWGSSSLWASCHSQP
jgi:hypothetical protein